MLLYGLLHLAGYALSMDEIRRFRQMGSLTPGHPECDRTPGVDMSTGPLGQGIATAVGMALAERMLAAEFNRDGMNIVDHRTWVFLGDGCLMEACRRRPVLWPVRWDWANLWPCTTTTAFPLTAG